jgi:alkylated DNA repair dioxygenase AlkB
VINYYPIWLVKDSAAILFQQVLTLPLTQSHINIQGRIIPFPRLTGFCNDKDWSYRYSGQTTSLIPWPPFLLEIRAQIENLLKQNYSTVLINYYRNQNDSVSFHKDADPWLKPNTPIVSLSLGASRKFKMRLREPKQKLEYILSNGDLFIFGEEHIADWEHGVPKETQVCGPRINLTFRVARHD